MSCVNDHMVYGTVHQSILLGQPKITGLLENKGEMIFFKKIFSGGPRVLQTCGNVVPTDILDDPIMRLPDQLRLRKKLGHIYLKVRMTDFSQNDMVFQSRNPLPE